jgi:hypothetical protein
MIVLKVGDSVRMPQKGRFVVVEGQLCYDQPPDEIVTIESEAELERMMAIAPKMGAATPA